MKADLETNPSERDIPDFSKKLRVDSKSEWTPARGLWKQPIRIVNEINFSRDNLSKLDFCANDIVNETLAAQKSQIEGECSSRFGLSLLSAL